MCVCVCVYPSFHSIYTAVKPRPQDKGRAQPDCQVPSLPRYWAKNGVQYRGKRQETGNYAGDGAKLLEGGEGTDINWVPTTCFHGGKSFICITSMKPHTHAKALGSVQLADTELEAHREPAQGHLAGGCKAGLWTFFCWPLSPPSSHLHNPNEL